MSTTAATHPQLRRRAGAQIPRRRSGPARPAPKPRTGTATPRQRTLAHALLSGAQRLGDARMLDRLVRGRLWLGIVAVALLGIVFMQVSLLRLNASVGVAVTKADTLERENSGLRGDISKLDSGERIQAVAAKLGMVMPPAGDVHFLDARGANAVLASTSITAPNPVKDAAPAVATTAPAATVAPAVTPAATATPAPAPVTATPAQTAPTVTQQAQAPTPTPTPTPATTQPAPAATAGAVAAPTGAR
jgi:cell division protein FtsL